MRQFKIGDKVKYTGQFTANNTPTFIGLEGEITELFLAASDPWVRIEITKQNSFSLRKSFEAIIKNITLIQKEPLTYSRALEILAGKNV